MRARDLSVRCGKTNSPETQSRGPLSGTAAVALVLGAAVSLGGCTTPCDNLQTASTAFNTKAVPCYGNGGYVPPAPDGGPTADAGNTADAGTSADAGPADAGAGVPTAPATFDEVVCENDITNCSKDDNDVLDRYASCLNGLPTCTPATQAAWSTSVQSCVRGLSSLSPACAAAFAGNGGDGGS